MLHQRPCHAHLFDRLCLTAKHAISRKPNVARVFDVEIRDGALAVGSVEWSANVPSLRIAVRRVGTAWLLSAACDGSNLTCIDGSACFDCQDDDSMQCASSVG